MIQQSRTGGIGIAFDNGGKDACMLLGHIAAPIGQRIARQKPIPNVQIVKL